MNRDAQLVGTESAVQPLGAAVAPSKIALGYMALAAPAIAIWVDALLAFARGWQIESRLDQLGLAALAAWLLLTTGLLMFHFGRHFFGQYFAQLLALSISFCGAWLLAELALGPLLARVGDPFHARKPGLEFSYRPQPGVMRDVGPEAHVRLNSWGIRGDEPPARDAAYRVLCLGGSSTACTYLDDTKTWPRLLQSDLGTDDPAHRYWVGNVGLPGFRIGKHRQFVEESPMMDQVDCLVVQAGINDFMAALAGEPPAAPLATHSRIWQLIRVLSRRHGDFGNAVEDTAGSVYTRRRAMRQAAPIVSITPQIEPALQQFADDARGIIADCRRRNVRPIFTTQSVLWRPDLDAENEKLIWFGLLPDGSYLSVDQLRAGMDRYNDTLRKICAEENVELIDLDPLSGDPAVFYDDCHFTETGARRVARAIADWCQAHPLVAGEKSS